MKQSIIFTKAHKIARNTVNFVGDYKIAFSIALKSIYKKIVRKMKIITEVTVTTDKGFKARVFIKGNKLFIETPKGIATVTGASIKSISAEFENGKKIKANLVENAEVSNVLHRAVCFGRELCVFESDDEHYKLYLSEKNFGDSFRINDEFAVCSYRYK